MMSAEPTKVAARRVILGKLAQREFLIIPLATRMVPERPGIRLIAASHVRIPVADAASENSQNKALDHINLTASALRSDRVPAAAGHFLELAFRSGMQRSATRRACR
jgi:hypothetical protein